MTYHSGAHPITERTSKWLRDCGVPASVIMAQNKWDRSLRIYDAMVAGASAREVAKGLGICTGRVHQLFNMMKEARREKSPFERWASPSRALGTEMPTEKRKAKKIKDATGGLAKALEKMNGKNRDWLYL